MQASKENQKKRKASETLAGSSMKKIRWDPSVREVSREKRRNSFFQKPLKKIKRKRFKKIVYSRMDQNEKEELQRDLTIYRVTEADLMSHYAEAMYDIMLSAALLDKTHQSLDFLVDALPLTCTQAALQSEHYEILKQFLSTPPIMKELGIYTLEKQQDRVQRWKALLRIDQAGINDYMSQNANIPQEAYAELKLALTELEQTPDRSITN